jgi:thiol-disulfide isomerase/thioredoxin
MERIILGLILSMSFINCSPIQFNTVKYDEEREEHYLVGYINKEAFKSDHFYGWYDEQYKSYVLDDATIKEIKTILPELNIKIVMATWCSDSRREVPAFIKILDAVNYPVNKLTLIGVDRNKSGLFDELEGLDIVFVPTFIISKGNDEIGRIIESPFETLELDLLEIIRNTN